MDAEIKITGNGETKTLRFGNIFMAAAGAAAVSLLYSLLLKVGAVFTAVIPFIAGGLLFGTLVGSFYFLLNLFKNMRKSSRLRVSFWDLYTAVAVFTVMGYLATACFNAFKSTGNPLALWDQGVLAAVLFTTFFGVARFVADLWKESDKKKSC